MFANSRNIAITGGNFFDSTGNSAFKELQRASAPSAFHNSSARFDPPKCHSNTRVAVLEYLMEWIFGRNDPEALILWLYGPAGAGKSAILQSIAERCFEGKVLLATFFFGRSDPSRNMFKPLVATIAYQIATTIPEIKPKVERAIEHDPLIFEKSLATQLQSLIVEPLKDLAASGFFNDPNNCARLVLIDGLDECDDPRMQSMILRVLANALRDEKLPLIFLVASRPEQHIALTFNTSPLTGLWRSLVLDDSYQPDDDIRLFLEDSFREIKTTHPHRHLIPEAWPAPSDVDALVEKSSGQFIYSSVVVKYVSAPVDRPPCRLDVIMGLRPTRGDIPFSELDALYKHILGSCNNLDTVLSILGIVIGDITVYENRIEIHLDLEPGEVEVSLAPLASIISSRKSHIPSNFNMTTIYLRHASFRDFLVDVSRSGTFYINTLLIRERLICKSVRRLMNPHSIPCQDSSMSRWTLRALVEPFDLAYHDVPLTETMKNALKEFSLPQFWYIWSTRLQRKIKWTIVQFVYIFLNCLTIYKTIFLEKNEVTSHPRPLDFSTNFYEVHISSFESIIRTEVAKYYRDVGMISLVVISILDRPISFDSEARRILLCLTNELEDLDSDSLSLLYSPYGRTLLVVHYRYLFIGPNASPELCLDGDKHAQAALRILEHLCHRPPHSIPHPKRQPLKIRSHRTGVFRVSNRRPHSIQPHGVSRGTQLTGNSFFREQREKKHRYGVALSLPDTSQPDLRKYSAINSACVLGLSNLPDILERSSYSPELVAFMRGHAMNIAFLPEWTRKAICAMHEYLDRSDEGARMVE